MSLETETCLVCGTDINDGNNETTECPICGRMRCESCDMGKNTICGDCEADDGGDT
jgi:hypothetical protein